MSLWRVKHTLSPLVEAALVAVVAAYGLFAIWYASLAPFDVSSTALLSTVPQPVPLDIDAWTRHDVPSEGYAFAAPPDWLVEAADPARVRLGRSSKELETAPASGEGVMIGSVALADRQDVSDLAAQDFAGTRAAFYDVSVDGHPSVFAIAFENGRVKRQAIYVPAGKGSALVASAASADPAVFAAFVSTIKFYTP